MVNKTELLTLLQLEEKLRGHPTLAKCRDEILAELKALEDSLAPEPTADNDVADLEEETPHARRA